MIKNRFLMIVMLFICGISSECFADPLETQLSNDKISLNDTVSVTYIENDNSAKESPDFSMLEKDFRILHTSYGNSVSVVNGKTSMQTLWRLELSPKKTGELVIPEINFGNTKSMARKLIVTANPAGQSTQNNMTTAKENAPLFVRGEISSTTPYVQSQVLYTLKLYFRTQLNNPRIDLPAIKDATFVQLADHPDYQTTIQGKVYQVVEKTFALFPKKSGSITISPMQFHAFVIDNNANAFNNFFTVDQTKPVTVATGEFHLSVRDVPTNYKGTTWLPANDISLTEQWSDHAVQWESGTPVTRTITVMAQGLRADQLPDLTIDKIDGVNVYVDPPKRSSTLQNNTLIGVLEQKVTYIPNNTQSFIIPSLKVNWWNTQTNSNATTQLNSMTVHVKTTAGGSTNTTLTPAASFVVNTQTAHQELQPVARAFYKLIWFWIACALFAAWMMTLWLMQRKKPVAMKKPDVKPQFSADMSEKNFEQACQSGQALQAQQYLLAWAKKQWPDVTLNLATLGDFVHDEAFKLALQELEQVLYARKTGIWDGLSLLTAFRRIKKFCKEPASISVNNELLPPLYPTRSKI